MSLPYVIAGGAAATLAVGARMMLPSKSYHIMKNFNTPDNPTWTFWWPLSGFGDYCTSEAAARAEYNKITATPDHTGYKLVSYPIQRTWYGGFLGLAQPGKVLEETLGEKKQ